QERGSVFRENSPSPIWIPKPPEGGRRPDPSLFGPRHADRRPFLVGRARIAAALRQFFAARDFLEVETTALVPSPGNETHLHAFATDLITPAATSRRLYLRTSPEFACKKLLAAGERRIVQFAPSFPNRERGPPHPPQV